MTPKTNNELRYYDALKTITKYMTVEQLRKNSMKHYGLTFEEALEMAYENIIFEAENAIKGRRRPIRREGKVKECASSE